MSRHRQTEQNGGKPKYLQKFVAQEKHLKMKLLSEFNLHHKVFLTQLYCKYRIKIKITIMIYFSISVYQIH